MDYMNHTPAQLLKMSNADGLIEINYWDRTLKARRWDVLYIFKAASQSIDDAMNATFKTFCLNNDKKENDFFVISRDAKLNHYTIIPLLNKEWA